MFDSTGAIQEIKDAILDEIYQLEDMLVNESSGERRARLSGKREAYQHCFDLLCEYE